MNKEKIRYILYARKSTESDDRQIQSLGDQKAKLEKLAKDNNLNIVGTFSESKSAKYPNVRPEYKKMIEAIESGMANGILCWDISRLARNTVEGGYLSWLLQQSKLQSIRTFQEDFRPEDSIFHLLMGYGMANQFIVDLSRNVRRGLDSKRQKGEPTNLAPLGYLNRNKLVEKDPERFPLIRKMWDLMLTGAYTPPQILEIANKEWGLRTRRYKNFGNKPMSRSNIYAMFTNIFYAGYFRSKDQQYKGNYEPMITMDEFDRVQFLLGRKGKPRPQTHHFAYTGLIRCEECGCIITAETKQKKLKCGDVNSYTYYHCTRKKREAECSQRECIREEKLEGQIESILKRLSIHPLFRDWGTKVILENKAQELKEQSLIVENIKRNLQKLEGQEKELLDMRLSKIISDLEYTETKERIKREKIETENNLRAAESAPSICNELTLKTFNFAASVNDAFKSGDLKTKREIVVALGQNHRLKDGKLNIDAFKWFLPIIQNHTILEENFKRLEPAENLDKTIKKEAFASLCPGWLWR